VLAIFALQHDHGLPPGAQRDAKDAWDMQTFGPLADGFEVGVPNARVVRIAHGKHAMFESNPTEVTNEIDSFIGGLKNKK
jgi:pimeloyl-ACP methyl ester carboxylesterase